MTNWDKKFIALAEHIATWSKDRSTKVGCVITHTGENRILSTGYNGFCSGANDDIEERHTTDLKYKLTEHAERNAIYNAAKLGIALQSSTMYLQWFPCHECARAIVQSGISRVVCSAPDYDNPRWGESFRTAREILKEGRVAIDYFNISLAQAIAINKM